MSPVTYDVVVVGGGPAGLAAATTLARSRRSVLVVDADEPRNAPSPAAHNVLGQEGVAPADLLARGRAEAAAYGAELARDHADDVRREDDGFVLGLRSGATVRGRRLVLASGLVDELPELPGLAEGWGHDVLHCPFCHGWEVRDQRIGVLGTGPAAMHQTLLFAQLSDDVTLFLHQAPPLSDEQAEQLAATGVRVVTEPVAGLQRSDDGALEAVELVDGTSQPLDALVVAPRFVARAGLYEQLGGVRSEHPMGGSHVAAGPQGATDVPGVWVAGNSGDLSATVVAAMAAGVAAGAGVHLDLIVEDTGGR